MKKLAILTFIMLVLGTYSSSHAIAGITPSKPSPPPTPELVEQGRGIYLKRCSFCHGLNGDGNGPAADYMDPRPRDFTLGTFKFRTTQSGELPTDADLFRTVSRGLSGTGMQAFDSDLIKNGLSEEERWAVIAYIKIFTPEFEDPEFDPVKTGKIVSLPSNQPPYSPELVAKGQKVFEQAKCWECHGKQGRGDGLKAFDKQDDWGFPIRIRNVTHPWKIKAGGTVEEIYMRFSTGILGTPMPSFVDALSEDDRWYLANFIKSLQHDLTSHQVLKVGEVAGEIPLDPAAEIWQAADPMDVRLTGQVVVAPRWQNPSVELVTVKAIHNHQDIAFLLYWDDPFQDTIHKKELELNPKALRKQGAFNSYVKANGEIPRALETFRDAIAIQFPVKAVDGTKKPHFVRGNSSNPVQLWHWQADQATKEGGRGAETRLARGWKQKPKTQPKEQQQLTSNAVWDKGRWHVVIKRPLITEHKNDVQFEKGRFIPMTLNAWDGSNGEHGLIMSLSTWYYVVLESQTPITIYLYTFLAVVLVGGISVRMVKKAEKEDSTADTA